MKGQGSLEFILLMVLSVALITGAVKALKDMDFINTVTVKPWAVVSGMIECGVWKPCGVTVKVSGYHPSNRVISYKPVGQ